MTSLAVAVIPKRVSTTCQLTDRRVDQPSHWLLNIPPERIGLHGEFDYYGLSKRVSHRISRAKDILGRLKVRQRGRVVVLSGQLSSPYQLHQVVELALSVDGVDEVDARSVSVTVAEAC